MSGPRDAAVRSLGAVLNSGAYSDTILDILLVRDKTLSAEDRALATEITYGTLRHLGRIDWVLARFSRRPLDSLDPDVLNILRCALYQILLLERVPAYAAVDEAVKQAQVFGKRSSGGFINGVLRSALRGAEAVDYPSPDIDPVSFLSVCHSLPTWLSRFFIDRFGIARATVIGRRYTERPPVILRANRLRTTRRDLIGALTGRGYAASETRFSPLGIAVRGGGAIFRDELYREGLFSLQDEVSQLAPIALGAGPPMTILDACAAPGIKGTFLAEIIGDRGRVVSLEINPNRARMIPENARRLGIGCLVAVAADITCPPLGPGTRFDRVIVDPPCSGLGVIRRNPEIKWRLAAGDLGVLVGRQREILARSAELVRPGGALVYAVCTINPDEGAGVVHDFLGSHPEFTPDDVGPFVGGACGQMISDGTIFSSPDQFAEGDEEIPDGFFIARLSRR